MTRRDQAGTKVISPTWAIASSPARTMANQRAQPAIVQRPGRGAADAWHLGGMSPNAPGRRLASRGHRPTPADIGHPAEKPPAVRNPR
ncbi:MAG: hypothetical protein ACXV3F_05535 [Frankiaceae bacterium]